MYVRINMCKHTKKSSFIKGKDEILVKVISMWDNYAAFFCFSVFSNFSIMIMDSLVLCTQEI